MKTQIQKMKQELKDLAHKIRETKKLRSKENSGYVYGLLEMRQAFRHKHVAYCLVRGRKLEQVDSGNKLDMEKVKWIMDSMNPESKLKLYVVVNGRLPISQQAVQAGHAVAEFLRKYPNTQWSNGYLIYLKDEPMKTIPVEKGGNMGCSYWLKAKSEYAEFVEPDLDNKVTAYALFGPDVESYMKNKTLL